MLMRRTWRFALGIVLVAALGCKSHPELSKKNDKGSAEWRHFEGSGTLSILSIRAGNLIDTPAGDKVVDLSVNCDGFHKLFDVETHTLAEPDSGTVSIGINDGTLSSKTWETDSIQTKGGLVYTIKPSRADQNDVLRQIKHGNELVFEFTPKGGKPQRSKFKLLNISALLDQDHNCKEAVASVQ